MSYIKTLFIECVVFKRDKNGINYLLIKRSINLKRYPGIWQIVTGTIENNEKAYETALRELNEETSLIPYKFFAIPHVNTFYYPKEDIINLVPVFLAEVNTGEVKIGVEHSEFKWLKIKDAVELIHFYSQKEIIKFADKFINDNNLFKTLTEIIL